MLGEQRGHGTIARALAVLALVVGITAGTAGTAVAAGVPVNVGTPLASGPPAVAVDASGDAIVVWANKQDAGGASDFVQYCVLPVAATTCAHSGSLVPADQAKAIDGTQVVVDGGVIAILADVFGTAGTNAQDYMPVQEWQSTDGGATFNPVAGGLAVSDGVLSADTGPLNAVIVPGTNVLGFGWDTAAGPETFNAFPLISPPECSIAHCPAGFATLEPASNPQQIGNSGGGFAAQAGAHPGVLGVFPTLFSNGPFGCPSNTPDGLAFAYGSGSQSATNSYNVSPGSPSSAWQVPATLGECGVKALAVGGGPSGFGVLADNEKNGTIVYQRFDQGKMAFGGMPLITLSNQGELDPALSQDAAGGVYATYLNGGTGGTVSLSFSKDGGTTWNGPATLDTFNSQDAVVSSVNNAGQGWVAWRGNGSVFAQPFTAADSVAATIAPKGSSSAKSIAIKVRCSSVPCGVKAKITTPSGHGASAAGTTRQRTDKRRRRSGTLAKGTFTIQTAGSHVLHVRLTRAGRRYIASHHGRVKLKVALTVSLSGQPQAVSQRVRVKIVKHKHHRRHRKK